MNEIVCYNIINIDNFGITLKYKRTDVHIYFDECAKNYANEKFLEKNKCIATRDITKLTLVFYTTPKTRVIFKKNFLKDLIAGKSAIRKFLDLQQAINKYGYTSFDLS